MNIVPLRVTIKAANKVLIDNQIVFIDGGVLIKGLVSTILLSFQLSHLIPESKGMIQIFDWKPIAISTICDHDYEAVQNKLRNVDCLIIIESPAHSSETVSMLESSDVVQSDPAPPPIKNNNVQLTPEMLLLTLINTTNFSPPPKKPIRYDQQGEIPLLNSWFQQNPSPPKDLYQNYANTLNEKNFRLANQRLSAENIRVWFKNRRHLQKKSAASIDNSLIT